MDWKRIGKTLLFPNVALMILLLPVAACTLIYAMLVLEENNPLRIVSYMLSFYTLMIWCMRAPRVIQFIRNTKNKNRYVRIWVNDTGLRTNVTLTGSAVWNGAYAMLQLGLGVYHCSAWFYSLAAYYTSLAVMRFVLVRHTLRHRPGENMQQELKHYRACGWIFLLMNLALSGMMLYMIRENREMRHHEITTIAMAAYTFTTLTVAIVNVIRYRKYHSPALSASRAISLAAACVAMLTLENTMLTTFRSEHMTRQTHNLFLGLSGGAISAFVIVMAVYMIVQANRKLKCMEN